MRATQTAALLLSSALLSSVLGCTWVKPVDGTEAVALVKPNVVQNCERLGKTTVQVKDSLGFINRNEEKVAKELRTMALNQAVEDGADTLVADSEPSDGRQTFSLYKCR